MDRVTKGRYHRNGEGEIDSLLSNYLQIRYYLVMTLLNFILFSVGFEFFDSFWGSVVYHESGLVLASLIEVVNLKMEGVRDGDRCGKETGTYWEGDAQ
jgi:hypothetical protein